MKKRAKAAESSDRLTRDQWIVAGLEALAEQGEPGVKIDVLAKKLNISRGSFYWHFQDRGEFLASIVTEWRRITTTRVHEDLMRSSTLTPLQKLKRLQSLSMTGQFWVPGGKLERALGQWATYDAFVAEILGKVHAERIHFIEGLFRELGQDHPAARAKLFYSYLVGRHYLDAFMPTGDPDQIAVILNLIGLGALLGPCEVSEDQLLQE